MKRIITIDNCENCPYLYRDQMCKCKLDNYSIIVGVNEYTNFPDYCPLPVKEEKEEQK